MKEAMIVEERLKFHHRAQSAVSTVIVAVSDNCLGSKTDMNDLQELWNQLTVRYAVPVEATINALLTNYDLDSTQIGESVAQCVDRFKMWENELLLQERTLMRKIGSVPCCEDFPPNMQLQWI